MLAFVVNDKNWFGSKAGSKNLKDDIRSQPTSPCLSGGLLFRLAFLSGKHPSQSHRKAANPFRIAHILTNTCPMETAIPHNVVNQNPLSKTQASIIVR